MKITTTKLIRWSGLAAMAAGLIFAAIQPIHPPDVVASVTTGTWLIITSFKLLMCFFFLIGITGLYARQVEESGWTGLVGYLLFSGSWALLTGFVFAEVFILPILANTAPQIVDSYLGLGSGVPGTVNIGPAAPAYATVGILYMLGGLVFGIAMYRARVLSRWPAALLALVAGLTPLAALLPHAVQRMVAGMPMGIAMIWLGYALWSEQRTPAVSLSTEKASAQRLQTTTE